jgi:hypothetical protein
MPRFHVGLAAVCCLALSCSAAYAQGSSAGLRDQMSELFVQSIVLARTPGGVGVVAHQPTFLDDPRVTDVTALVDQIAEQIGTQVANFPLGSSSGGFTYTYDAALGTFSRSTATFGPAFAERAVAAGRGKFSFGFNYSHASYDSLDGRDLKNGDIKFFLKHQALTPPSFVEGDVIQAALAMKLGSDTAALLGNYGVTDRLDLGIAVPIVRVNMDLTYHATILDFATHVVSPTTHLFANGSKQQDFNAKGSASGIGDVIVRAKYVIANRGAQGVGVGLDVSLPTGDEANMIGTGVAQTKMFFIASGEAGSRLSPHVNIGYTVARKDSRSRDQFGYVGGAELLVNRRTTLMADLIGRTYRNALRLEDSTLTQVYQQGAGAPFQTADLNAVSVVSKNLSQALGAFGVKVNPAGSMLISAQLLMGLNDAGLRAKFAPVIGFDFTF